MSLASKSPDGKPRSFASQPRGAVDAARLECRAQADLEAIAEAMQARQRDPLEILLALSRQAELWRACGAALPAGAALAAVRHLPGLRDFDPLPFWSQRIKLHNQDELVEGIDPGEAPDDWQQRRRALVLSEWLQRHAGTASAENAVRAVERHFCESLGGVV
jgi:hypothetical protein